MPQVLIWNILVSLIFLGSFLHREIIFREFLGAFGCLGLAAAGLDITFAGRSPSPRTLIKRFVDIFVIFSYYKHMHNLSPLQQVELFHLIFLRLLEQSIPKNCYAIKGGCNLRFFFKSIRYSEDIDLDVWSIREDILGEKVHKIFKSSSFNAELNNVGIELENTRAPKQTETTQRWKMAVRARGASLAVPTKIEFSRRTKYNAEQILLERIDPELTNAYNLFPIMVMHYSRDTALAQKLSALLNRTKTQARDIFDIALLLEKGAQFSAVGKELRTKIKDIEDKIVSIDYATFHSQVVSFLDPRFQHYYRKDGWETVQLTLVERLREL